VAYCHMFDSVPSVGTCSSSSSCDSSSSESVRTSPPSIPDLFIFAEVGDIPKMPEVEVNQWMVPIETEADAVSPVVKYSCFCMFRMLCGAFVSYVHLDIDYIDAHGDDDDDGDAGLRQMVQGQPSTEIVDGDDD
jgi:hypothetical protein